MKLEAAVVEKAKGYVWARALGSIGYLLVLVGSGSFSWCASKLLHLSLEGTLIWLA